MRIAAWLVSLALGVASAQTYDLLLKGGHVIDPKNGVNQPMDVAIAAGKVARVARDIPAAEARRVANVKGLYVSPGWLDIHVHVYAGTGHKVIAGDQSVYPDGFSFRAGVTTMVDAGTAGWRNFPDFRQRVIDRARTRVLAMINIVGGGMGITSEHDPADMDAAATARMAAAHKDIVVGFKTAHYNGKGWPAVDGAVKAGEIAGLPLMIDFGTLNEERNLEILMRDKLRPGDMYTHCYSGLRQELHDGVINPAMTAGRKRGILFDLGHGGGSFFWNIAVPMFQQGFYPDIISTDLHTGSMNGGMKDLPTTMSKVLLMGRPLTEVVKGVTSAAAQAIRRPELGNLDAGAEADVTVFSIQKGDFGLLDSAGARYPAKEIIQPELTVRKGVAVWDRNGWASTDWKSFNYRRR